MGAEPHVLHRQRQLQFQQRDVTRALRGARAAGYEDVRIEILPSGATEKSATRFSGVSPRMSNRFSPPASVPKADIALGIVTLFLRTHRVVHRRISMGYGRSADSGGAA